MSAENDSPGSPVGDENRAISPSELDISSITAADAKCIIWKWKHSSAFGAGAQKQKFSRKAHGQFYTVVFEIRIMIVNESTWYSKLSI